MAFETRFAVRVDVGACAGVTLPGTAPPEAEWPAALPEGERAFARGFAGGRRASWIGGRVALRAALALAGLPPVDPVEPILATDRGAPRLPAGVTGSISHKPGLAVAIAGRAGLPPVSLGIDLEQVRPLRTDIAPRVLTAPERAALPAAGPARDRAVLRLFCAKEAIYKALDPWVGRYVRFDEAEVTADTGGGLSARLALDEGPFAVRLVDLGQTAGAEHILIVAVARPA